MTIIEILNESILDLGNVRSSVDEQEDVGLPVRKVRDRLVMLKNFFEEQERKQKEQKEQAEGEEEI